MKIVVLGLNYLPESTSIGPYTADLAEHLKDRGHDVRVITGFPMAPQWKVRKEYEGKWFMSESMNGVALKRTYLYLPRNPKKTLSRILFDCSFAISALAGMFARPQPDLVVIISPPLQLAITAFVMATFARARVFLQIKDLVPDAAVAVGALRPGSRILHLAQALERFVYRRSDGIGVICEGMRQNLLSKGVPPAKVTVLPDYIDLSFIRPMSTDNDFRSRFGFGRTDFLAVYSGSVAAKQGLQTFVEAGGILDHEPDITCCLIGEGPYLSELQQVAKDHSLQRFRFLPLQPREVLSEQLSAADVLVITQRKEVRDIVFPGKLLYYMAAGRPILAAVAADSETGRFIGEHEVGIVVPPEDPQRLAEAIQWLRDHPEQVKRLGENGRRTAEKQFDRKVVLEQFDSVLECCAMMNDQVYA